MPTPETLTQDGLSLELSSTDDSVRLVWRGRSTAREPGTFLMPALKRALVESGGGKKLLLIDFTELEYMNSSSFAPLVKALAEAAQGSARVAIHYAQKKKWQELSFSALRAFQTPDGRISLRAI